VPPGASRQAAEAITTGSHLAFMDGFQTALAAASVVAVAAALVAVLVRRGQSPVGETAAA
jgi:hypothetical protein